MQVLDDVLGVNIHEEQKPILVLTPGHAAQLRKTKGASKQIKEMPHELAGAPNDKPIEVLPTFEAFDLAKAARLLKSDKDRIYGMYDARD